MALSPTDEFPHPHPEPLHERYQENYYLLGWDDERRAGFSLHLERFVARHDLEVRAIVVLGDSMASYAATHTLTEAIGGPGFVVEISEPFREWHLHLDVAATAARDLEGFLVMAPGEVPVGLDITLRSTLAPIDWSAALLAMGVPGTEHDHYEVACTWDGRVMVDGAEVDASGLLVRDHTWGRREYHEFPFAWWTPACLDGANAYFTGASVLREGRWFGTSILATQDEVITIPEHLVTIDGHLGLEGYSGTTIRTSTPGGAELCMETTSRVHLPARWPGFSEHYYMNDAFSMVRIGDRTGFGDIELNANVAPGELEALLAHSER